MNEKNVIREAMKSCGWTQEVLAKKAGYSAQSSLSSRLNGKSMRVDTFVKLLSAMGYKLVVCSTSPNTNKNKWVVDIGEETRSDNEVDSHPMQKANHRVRPRRPGQPGFSGWLRT